MARRDDTLGAKLGERWAELTARTRLSIMERSRPELVRLAMAAQDEFFRLTGSEVNRTVGPLWRQISDAPDAPDWLRRTGAFLADGKGQWATLFAGTATGAALGGGLLGLITNELQPVVGYLMRQNPHMPLSAPDAAAAQARGLSWGPDLWAEAGQSGLNRDRFDTLVRLNQHVVDVTEVLELYRRGEVTREKGRRLLARAGWEPDSAEYVLGLARQFVSVQDAAAFRNRNIITVEQGRAIARLNGYSDEDYDRFDLLAGVPPDLTSVILAWRRGVINESDVDRAIIQGPLRNEWIPVVKQLQWEPLPVDQAANAVNQGHLDYGAAVQVAAQSGVRETDFKIIVDNAGIPPGPQEALDWISRGIISEDEFRAIFLESRIKNKYIDLYLQSRKTPLTLAEIRLLYERGAMTREQAAARLTRRGYTAEDAAIIIDGASAHKTTHERDLTKAEILELYTDQAITADDVTGFLQTLGYDQSEAQQLVQLADLRRTRRLWSAALSHVRSMFVSRRASDPATSAALDAMQIPPDARDQYMTLWRIERGVATRDLTTAQIVAAVKAHIIDVSTATDRLEGQGYSSDDALILLQLGKAVPVQPITGGA